jgi:hypothetical protein
MGIETEVVECCGLVEVVVAGDEALSNVRCDISLSEALASSNVEPIRND